MLDIGVTSFIISEKDLAIDKSELIAFREGDPAITESFIREHAVWMLAVARRVLRGDAQVEDVVQTAFSNIFKSLNAFEGKSTLRTWMHRIVVNEAMTALRKDRRLQEVSIEDLQPSFDENSCRIEECWTTFETPETLMQKSQTRVVIIELIDRLPDKYRIVLILRDIEELSTTEVSGALALSESGVKKAVGTDDQRTRAMMGNTAHQCRVLPANPRHHDS